MWLSCLEQHNRQLPHKIQKEIKDLLKMTEAKKQKTTEMKRVLVFGGKTGWIGQMMVELTKKEGTHIVFWRALAIDSIFARNLL